MKTRFLDQEYLDGLYQYRNKNYGAYLIIKTHERRMFWSFIFTVSLFILFIFGYTYFQFMEQESVFDNSVIYSQVILSNYQNLQPPLKPVIKKKSSSIQITDKDEQQEKNDSLKTKKQEKVKKDSISQIDNLDNNGIAAINSKKDSSFEAKNILHTLVDKLPEYPGGDSALKNYLSHNLVYPDISKKQMIVGLVKVAFIVEENGSISNIKIVKGVHPTLDNEVLRVVKKMSAWSPSYRNGKPIRFYCTIPVRFEPIVVQTN